MVFAVEVWGLFWALGIKRVLRIHGYKTIPNTLYTLEICKDNLRNCQAAFPLLDVASLANPRRQQIHQWDINCASSPKEANPVPLGWT